MAFSKQEGIKTKLSCLAAKRAFWWAKAHTNTPAQIGKAKTSPVSSRISSASGSSKFKLRTSEIDSNRPNKKPINVLGHIIDSSY